MSLSGRPAASDPADMMTRRSALRRVGLLQGVFGGHYHAYTEKEFHGTPVVTGRCCSRLRGNHDGTKEKGWWSLSASAGRPT